RDRTEDSNVRDFFGTVSRLLSRVSAAQSRVVLNAGGTGPSGARPRYRVTHRPGNSGCHAREVFLRRRTGPIDGSSASRQDAPSHGDGMNSGFHAQANPPPANGQPWSEDGL